MTVARPLATNVLVKPLAGDEMTAGGVLLPDEVRNRGNRGMVVATGPGYRDPYPSDDPRFYPLEVKPGDMVIWNKEAGVGVEVQGEELLVLDIQEVLVVLQEDEREEPERFDAGSARA